MKKEVIKPPRLRQGDTIGVVAPAGPFERDPFDQGVATLEAMGFQVKVPEGIFEQKNYLAGSDEHRAKLLTELFQDPAVRAIFCVRGGYGSARILPFLDFKQIAANSKILVGFSDITVLLNAFYHKLGLITFHGPLVTTLGKSSERTRDILLEAITSDQPATLTPSEPVVLHPGHASGPVIGGNLTNICHLIGTPYEPEFAGALLLLEDRGEPPYRIDRMLCHLRLSGRLKNVAGVVVGSFKDCGDIDMINDAVKENFAGRDIPILAGFDIGHDAENLTVPIGLQATLDTESGVLRFDEPATSPL
jgi:muramoyltetrapeptide carboxypeptidase